MHVSTSTYIRTNQTNAKTVESGSSRNNLYYRFIISIILPVIALVGLNCRQKRQRTHLKRMRMQETCQSNAGVYRRTTIPLEIVSVASVSSFESSVSSKCMSGSSEHVYASVKNVEFLPSDIREDELGYLTPASYRDTITTKL